ncbi:uncharacterized protein LOC141571016 [Rhinolophus sinicus]|uniref:uncharacterized protein LOC141571016 n=1 Tax=Rhinolophus sinicus TaxID=89399 RepID=UPI003D7B9B35
MITSHEIKELATNDIIQERWVSTFRDRDAFRPPVSPLFPPRPCPPAAQARPGPSPPARCTEPLLTASWGWYPTPARREWPWAPPWQPTRLSALCTHWYSEPPGAGPADGPREPAASARRGPVPGPGPDPLQSRGPRQSRRLHPPPRPPPWLPPCAAARDRWAQVKGHSERRPARPFAAAHPGSHRGDWAAGAMRLKLHILSSRPPRPPSSAVTPPAVCTCRAGVGTEPQKVVYRLLASRGRVLAQVVNGRRLWLIGRRLWPVSRLAAGITAAATKDCRGAEQSRAEPKRAEEEGRGERKRRAEREEQGRESGGESSVGRLVERRSAGHASGGPSLQ